MLPQHYIDLTDPRWACPELKLRPRFTSPDAPVIDLTAKETKEIKPETQPETKGCLANGDSCLEGGITNINVLNGQDFKLLENSSGNSQVVRPQQDCGAQNATLRPLNSLTQLQKQSLARQSSQDAPQVKLDQFYFLKSHPYNLKTSGCSVQLIKDSPQMSLCFKPNNNCEAGGCPASLETTSKCIPEVMRFTTEELETSQERSTKPLKDQATHTLQISVDVPNAKEEHDDVTLKQYKAIENKLDGVHLSDMIPSTSTSLSQDKTQKEAVCSTLEKLDSDNSESGQRPPSDHPSSHSPHCFKPDSVSYTISTPLNHANQGGPSPKSDYTPSENMPDWQLETVSYGEDAGGESPMSIAWQGESDREDINEEGRFFADFREVSREDRRYVCPITLKKLMAGQHQVLVRNSTCISFISYFF